MAAARESGRHRRPPAVARRTGRLLPNVPPAASVLGLAGVIPFAATALGSLKPEALGDAATMALLAYGAVILAFTGDIQRELVLARGAPAQDLGLAREGMGAAWFQRLRLVLTAAVVLCLLLAALL
jgi:hypothetical protein